MAKEGKYLYCIIKKPNSIPRFKMKGVGGQDVYTISESGLSAVVSDSEIKEYFITRENLLTHQKVIEEVSKRYNALPVSFGAVAASPAELKEKILKSGAKDLENSLKEIQGKIELGLKALWIDMKSIFQEIAESSQTIRNLKKLKNISYQQKISAGELAGKMFEEKRDNVREEILRPLGKIADDIRENKIFGDDMILNAAFLVKKPSEKKFDKAVNALGERFGKKIRFVYVGPLPPFNFIKLSL